MLKKDRFMAFHVLIDAHDGIHHFFIAASQCQYKNDGLYEIKLML